MAKFGDQWGKARELQKKARPGDVVLGAPFTASHLSMNYATAARALFKAIDSRKPEELTAPIFFLARHAIELALKDLVHGYHANERDQAELDQADGKVSVPVLSVDEVDELLIGHVLKTLLKLVKETMPYYVTPQWEELVKTIEDHERGSVERFRFERVHSHDPATGKKTGRMEGSFDEPQLISVPALLDGLDRFMVEAAKISEPGTVDETTKLSALEDLAYVGNWLDQELYQRGLL